MLDVGTGAAIVALGPVGYALQVAKVAVKAGWVAATDMVHEVSPNRHLETPSGDELPDLLGPGKGDVYYGEGWTLGLQTKYRLGIQQKKDGTWELTTAQIQTYDILERTNQYIYTIRDIENIIGDLEATIPQVTDDKEKKKLEDARSTWEGLLSKNLAYVWNRDYLSQGKPFADFESVEGSSLGSSETLIFSAGPTFEYSRAISAATSVTFSVEIGAKSGSEFSHEMEVSAGFKAFGSGTTIDLKSGSSASIESGTDFGAEWESGQSTEQSVGFALSDDDIGDNISTRVYGDPVWGTPLFFQDPGSVTSDPWEPGTNKGIDVKLELFEGTVSSGPFDYTDGAHYKVKVTYEGMRELETDEFDFELLAPPTDNPDNTYVEFNGYWGPYPMELAKGQETAIVAVSVFPPKQDMGNSEEKEYSLAIQVKESADDQISRSLELKVKFADLRAPRTTIVAPYAGQRISPVLFPESDPFDIQVISEDMDIASIQLQIRTKQPDSVWEPWRNLSGMVWKDGEANPNVEVFDRPSRREFTFRWTENEIKTLGVGEYALRAVATDKATKPNVDIDPPDVVFLVDDSEPTVLTTLPDYQARESQRIYRGELSAIFTDDMRADDFSDRTYLVTDLLKGGQKVAGFVSYSPALRKAVFVPIVPFQPNGFYRVEIKTDVKKPVDSDVEVDVGGASNLQNVALKLEAAGWHAIGNPFILPVNVADLKLNGQAFDDAVTAGLVESTLYRWKVDADPASNPDAYEEITNTSQLNPWDGCWLKTKQADLTLTIPAPAGIANAQIDLPDTFDPPMAPPAPSSSYPPISASQFDLRLELVSSFSSDVTTVLGTRRNAQVGWDAFDQSEPPALSKTAAVYFDHPDWGPLAGLYNKDYQPILEAGEQRTWEFTVHTDRSDARMTLSWEKSIARIPGDVMLHFRRVAQASPLPKGARGLSLPVDDGQSDWQDMREVRSVDLLSRSRITEFSFEARAQRFQMSPPSDVQVIPGEKQVTLRWRADDNKFIDSYAINRQSGSAEDWREGEGTRCILHQDTENPVSEFVDTDVLEEVTYTYQISVRFKSGAGLPSELFTVRTLPVIKRTALLQSYPNPFNPEVWIPYDLAEEAPVSIRIYNASGQLIRSLDLGVRPRGRYTSKEKAVYWDGLTQAGEQAASGVYFYVLRAADFTSIGKMTLIR